MTDLDEKEQKNVRTALRYLRVRYESWEAVARALSMKVDTVRKAASGHDRVSARIAFRTARLADVAIDDLLAGRFTPAGTCPHCGRPPDFSDERTVVEEFSD